MEYSIVIPLHNEEDTVKALIEETIPVMQGLNQEWEILCVDDGSTDSTLLILQSLMKTCPHLRILSFVTNFGQSSAFAAGFEKANGRFIITMDGDGQNDPRDIPKLLELTPNADLVVGWRVHRKDTFSKRLTSRFANAIRSRFCQDGVHDTGCSLKVLRAASLNRIKMYHGMHRFLPALFRIEGFRVMEVPVNHRERQGGKTKYHFFNRSIGPIIDMFVVRWMRYRHLKHQIREEITS